MAKGWDSGQYLKFAGPRLRPALDLLARINVDSPQNIYDLGCGPGNVTQLLAERWPDANITGVDGSPDMLARAAAD
ncbi:MAG: methyltransferase domain-containing protein, partial [Rhodospirillales bacterium]|nr:methyltransferase domain-containing protein [Rhodospirillales bacterium]